MDRPSLAGIEDALKIVRQHQDETPLVRSEMLSRILQADVWLKNETVSPIASFKLRGALTDIVRAQARAPLSGVVTSSTGNHGLGVAYAAHLLGLPADIFLPIGANPLKAAAIEAVGATLHSEGVTEDEASAGSVAFAKSRSRHLVDDGGSLDLVEGAGTVGLEIARRLTGIDFMIVPVGDGALIGGSACALKAVSPPSKVIGVQAYGAPAMAKSFYAGRALSAEVDTIADGLASANPTALAVNILRAFVDDIITVSETEILLAIRALAEWGHVLAEPAAAASMAGAWNLRDSLRGKRVVLLVTGANVTMDILARAVGSPALPDL